jgi:hypothetical protein
MKFILIFVIASAICNPIRRSNSLDIYVGNPVHYTVSWNAPSTTIPNSSPIANYACIRTFTDIEAESTPLITTNEDLTIKDCTFSDNYDALTITKLITIPSLIEFSNGILSLTNVKFTDIYIAKNSII